MAKNQVVKTTKVVTKNIKTKQVTPTKTKDSTDYFKTKGSDLVSERNRTRNNNIANKASKEKRGNDDSAIVNAMFKADQDMQRQKNKGKAGFDANGYPKKKK